MNDLDRELRRAANAAVKDVARDAQKSFDKVHRRHAGSPVSVVESALRRELAGTAIDPNRAQLKNWANLISQGTRIRLDPQQV